MATRKKGLGLGLEALLGPKVVGEQAPDDAPTRLELARLSPGRYQPRTRMDEGALYELAESIRSQGVMQPVLVRPVGDGRYEIIAGERRVRAAALAGLDAVPVLVRDVPDESAAVMALIENIQREDLNPLEEAQGLQRLVGEFGLTHEQAAQAVGRSRSAASNLLRLLNLAEPVRGRPKRWSPARCGPRAARQARPARRGLPTVPPSARSRACRSAWPTCWPPRWRSVSGAAPSAASRARSRSASTRSTS